MEDGVDGVDGVEHVEYVEYVEYVSPRARTLGELFCLRVRASGARPAHFQKEQGRWQPTSWEALYLEAARIAQGLVRHGVGPGERVAILGPTSGRWACLELAAQLAGVVSVGVYPRQTVEQLRYLLEHSDARVVFVEGDEELDNVLAAVAENDQLGSVVAWRAELARRRGAREPRLTWLEPFAGAEPIPDADRDRRLAGRQGDHTAIFIYTSGTTGPPKAAMISQENVLSLLRQAPELLPARQDDVALGFLPMAHAAERVVSFYGRLDAGVPAYYASSVGAVLAEVQEARPTVFGVVPRILEKAHARIHGEVDRKPLPVRRLFAWAERIGRQRLAHEAGGTRVPLGLRWRHRIADRLVYRKIRRAFGGRVRQFICGAAPLSRDVLEFFWAVGLPVYELYGMTEATAVTHGNGPGRVKLGTVGQVVAPGEQRIAEDGEVQIRAPWVFQGYHKDPEATAETVVDGWLHTGDLGAIDEEGYLRLTDRKKHLIITAGGKNLSPATIENAIKAEDPLISYVHVHGDRRPFVSALIAPSPLETLQWGGAHGRLGDDEIRPLVKQLQANPQARGEALNAAMARVVADPRFGERLREAVRRGNARLARVEAVRRFVVLERDLSVEQGEITPTMKVKRKAIERKFAALFERTYAEPGFAIET